MNKVGEFLHEISEICTEPQYKLGFIVKIDDTVAYVQCLGVIEVEETETAVLFFQGITDYPNLPNKEVKEVWDTYIESTTGTDKDGE